jgi:hypothetical protein
MIKIHALEFEFRKALLEPAIDVSRLAQLRGQINRLKEAVDATVNENLIAEAQIFTAEQRKKMRMDLLRHELGPAGFKLPEHQGESAKP